MKPPVSAALFVLVFGVSACAGTPARSAENVPSPRAFASGLDAARYLVALRGPSGVQVGDALSLGMRANSPGANAIHLVSSVWMEKYAPPDSVSALSALVLARHFSLEDLTAIIRFEESPAGRRQASEVASVTGETMAAINKLLDPHRAELEGAMLQIMTTR